MEVRIPVPLAKLKLALHGSCLNPLRLNWGLGVSHSRSKRSEEHKMSAYASNRKLSISHISHYTDRAIVVLNKKHDCYLAVSCELKTRTAD
jgi:hypothetical protein